MSRELRTGLYSGHAEVELPCDFLGVIQSWVVTTDVLDHELGSQKSLGMRTLNRLTSSVTWTGIRARVDACVETRRAN